MTSSSSTSTAQPQGSNQRLTPALVMSITTPAGITLAAQGWCSGISDEPGFRIVETLHVEADK